MRQTTRIFGYNFICDTSYEKLADDIISDVEGLKINAANFITPNAHGINVYLKYPELNRFCQSSKYVLPDGQPIVLLSRLTAHPIKNRLTGSDFFPVMFRKIKDEKYHCLFIVSNEELKQKFICEKPGASYLIPEYFEMWEKEKINEIANIMTTEIMSKHINYVFIGISEPKQGALAQNVSRKLMEHNYKNPCIFFFLGASFEFYFGLKKRAPLIYQKLGLEWFYRLMAEPRRMFTRYVFGNFIFIFRCFIWIINKKAYN